MLTKFLKSTDSGAPALDSSSAGTFQAVLDAILVNGYNSNTITITRSGTTATATATSHGFTDGQVLLISGANETDYNGEYRITNVTTNTFDYTVANSPTTPATGTITAVVAPFGWATAYSSSNDRSYSRPGASNGGYLNVSDGATSQSVRIRFFSTVTAAGTTSANGTNPTPTDAMLSGGGYCWLGTSATTQNREWLAIGNDRSLYFFIDISGAYSYNGGFFLTDVADAGGQTWFATPSSSYSSGWFTDGAPNTGSYSSTNCYSDKSAADTGSCTRQNSYAVGTASSVGIFTTYAGSYATYGLVIVPVRYFEPNAGLWGRFPGMYAPTSLASDFTEGDTLQGAAGSAFAGQAFRVIKRSSWAMVLVETSDDWSY